jgi:hypothetical protein
VNHQVDVLIPGQRKCAPVAGNDVIPAPMTPAPWPARQVGPDVRIRQVQDAEVSGHGDRLAEGAGPGKIEFSVC